jgi:hypothetical protein
MAIRRIRTIIGDNRREFTTDDVVNAVQALVATIERPPDADID